MISKDCNGTLTFSNVGKTLGDEKFPQVIPEDLWELRKYFQLEKTNKINGKELWPE